MLDQLVQLEGVADGMHDSVLEHRVDAVARPPSRWVLGSLQLFVGDFPELWPPPPLENVLQIVVRFAVHGSRVRSPSDSGIR